MVPADWKEAIVTPVYKKGAKNKAENYRPIKLTSIVCNLMESLVKEVIMNHLIDNKLLSKKQYGFISGRSTALQLLSYLDKYIEEIVNENVIDTV